MSRLLENPRRTFEALKWLAVLALVALPLTLSHGWLKPHLLIGAALFGAIWIGLTLFAWRVRSQTLLFLLYGAFFIGPRLFGLSLRETGVDPLLQWLCLAICTAGLPLLWGRLFWMRIARLEVFPAPFSHEDC